MMIIPQSLLFLLALMPYLEASGQTTTPRAPDYESFARAITEESAKLALSDPFNSPPQVVTSTEAGVSEDRDDRKQRTEPKKPDARTESIGGMLAHASKVYMEVKESKIETIVKKLDEEIGELKGKGYSDTALAALLNRFVEVNPEELLSAALETKATHLLKILQYLYIWETEEQYHLYLAHVYKMEDCYVKDAWKGGPVSIDWGKHWKTVFMADNPKILEAIRSGEEPANLPFILDEEKILALVIEYDAFKIFKSLGFANIGTLKSRLGQLAEWGSISLLEHLLESGEVGDDLHLERYHFPKKLSKKGQAFFFSDKNHGYERFPAPKLQLLACEGGFFKILRAESRYPGSPYFKTPPAECAAAAAKGGHLDILKWLKKHANNFIVKNAALAAAQNGKLEVLEWLEGECACVLDQDMANAAFSHDQIKMTQFIKNKAGILPDASTIGNSSVRRFEWISSTHPSILTSDLLACVNTAILEHLWGDPQNRDLFLEDIKEKQVESIKDVKKLRLVLSIWERLPKVIDWDISIEDLEEFAWAFKEGRMAITLGAANTAILEYLWKDPQKHGFFSKDIEEKQLEFIRDGKTLRLVFSIWERLPKVIDWDISVEDLEEFAWAFKEGRMTVTLGAANTAILEYLWKDPQKHGFFSKDIEEKQLEFIRDGKTLRLTFSIWKRLPKVIDWDISVEDLEEFAWAFKERTMEIAPEVANMAAASGNIASLQWFEANGYSLYLTKDIISIAVENGHFDIAKYFNSKVNPEREYIRLDMKVAYERDDVEMLQWALDNYNCRPPHDLYSVLPRNYNDHLNTFEWLVRIYQIHRDNFRGYQRSAYNDGSTKIVNYLHKRFDQEREPTSLFFKDVWNNTKIPVNLDRFKEIVPALSPDEIEFLLSSGSTPMNARAYEWLLQNRSQENIAK